ncbi:uncharacterized protein LOC5506859 isoform X1 [Nematostella vectensis]|uniref:uncharacterized protein LOC5506859 isoform X1 n=2 Tax=Nematostella vectensis TaxID=45351 RepID=UPI0020772C1D|nr:uncharacterized protein LOC5506859 isoform X1 [Nematostella vectensis]
MGRRRRLEIALGLLIVVFSSTCNASNTTGCPAELKDCEHIVQQHKTCQMLDNVCSKIHSEPANATRLINEINTREKCASGEIFCPVVGKCQSNTTACDIGMTLNLGRDSAQTPWGANCTNSTTEGFCAASMSCGAKNRTCTLQPLYDWTIASNNSVTLSGSSCNSGDTYCLATSSCKNSSQSCNVPLPQDSNNNASSLMEKLCESGHKFCPDRFLCIENNKNCSEFGSLPYDANTTDPGNGWLKMCKMRKYVCTLNLIGAAKCMPKVAHCLSSGNTTNNNSTSNNTSPGGGNTTNNNSTNNNTSPGGGGGGGGAVTPVGCPVNTRPCNLTARNESCIPMEQGCPETYLSPPCPPEVRKCVDLVEKRGLCSERHDVCDALTSGNSSRFQAQLSAVNMALCQGGDTFCPLVGQCISSADPCGLLTSGGNSSMVRLPWGGDCPTNQSYCPVLARCSATCSAQAIYDWSLVMSNESVGLNGEFCAAGQKYCFTQQSCISNVSQCNVPKSDLGFLCGSEDHYCDKESKCVSKSVNCTVFPSLNYTGVNDTNSGWEKACKLSLHICHRRMYAIKQCENTLKDCYVSKNLTRYVCGPGWKWCQILNKCINAIDGCCANGTNWCKEQNKCIPGGSKCILDPCKDIDCAAIDRRSQACGSLGDQICPIFANNWQNFTSAFYTLVNTEPCPVNENFCILSGNCEKSCTVDTPLKGLSNESVTPWGANCSSNERFCFASQRCQPRSDTCSFRSVYDWIQAKNRSVTPSGSSCPGGNKFCLTTYSCIPEASNCTANKTLFSALCGSRDMFCPSLFKCIRMNQACPDFPVGNYSGNDNGTGFLAFCQMRKYICPRLSYSRAKCAAYSRYAPCVQKNRCDAGFVLCNWTDTCIANGSSCSQCPAGQSFCEKTSPPSCIPASQYCLAPRECPPHQTICPELGGCINKTITCQPDIPASAIVYKTVWEFETIEAADASIFSSGTTIAILSVRSPNSTGALQCYNAGSWKNITGISAATAYVVAKTDKLRFMHTDPQFHGMVFLNYTVKAGTAGTKVDASSDARTADQVLVLPSLPRPDMPVLQKIGGRYNISEDDTKTEGVLVSNEMNLVERDVSTVSSIPTEDLPFIERATTNCYFEALKTLKSFQGKIVALSTRANSSQGGFEAKKKSWTKLSASFAKPEVVDPSDKIRFVPAVNWHGEQMIEFAGAVVRNNDVPVQTFDLPPRVEQFIAIRLIGKNASADVVSEFPKVMGLVKGRSTQANIVSAIDTLDVTLSAGAEKTALAALKTLIQAAFADVAAVDGLAPTVPLHAPVVIGTAPSEKIVMFTNTIAFRVTVNPVNDAPILTSYRAYLPPIGYNLTTTPNNGFTVNEVTTRIPIPYGTELPAFAARPDPLITDVDGYTAGIGIAYAPNTSLGRYEYRLSNSDPWTPVPIDNTLENGKLNGTARVLLLKPEASVRFQMHSDDFLWSNVEASEKAQVLFVAWDQTDNKTSGVHNFTFPPSESSSISKKFVMAFATRNGCDGKPGSRGRVDACGRCGGDGVWCRGCDNIPFSGAIKDHCGNCTGGTTNLTFNFRKDCAGTCGSAFTGPCGLCQSAGKFKNFTDCSGTCFGGATINRCGNCVGGNTGNPSNQGEDACGICGGDGSSCLDCAGQANGPSKVDICGSCLNPTSPSFNSACTKLSAVTPASGVDTGGTRITIKGAGLTRITSAACYFVNSTGDYATPAVTKTATELTFTMSAIEAGVYQVKCRFDGAATDYFTTTNFTAYDKSAMTISSITPARVIANSGALTVNITGTGFVDTGYIRCVSDVGFSSPATFISSTDVQCSFPNRQKSKAMKVSVSMGQQDTEILGNRFANFEFYVQGPMPVSAAFTNNLQAILVTMSKPSVSSSGEACTPLFTDTSSFGTQAKCVFRTPLKMFILLRGSPSLTPGNVIQFNASTLTVLREDVTVASTAITNLTVSGPAKTPPLSAILSGPNKVGVCGKIKLDASRSFGGGGRRLTFSWGVAWASDTPTPTSAANTDLARLQDMLQSETGARVTIRNSTNLLPNFKYEFRVSVSNFLGASSENATLVVTRENKQLPIIEVGHKVRQVKASRDVTLQAKAVLSPCLDPSVAASVLFSWEIDAVGIDLGVTDKPRLRIKQATLEGGKTYTLTVTAAMASDQTLSSTKSITLNVESSPLVARIRGGATKVVGATSTMTMDASPSIDPDKTSETAWYRWACFDSSENPCFRPDPVNAGRQIRVTFPTTAQVSFSVADYLSSNQQYKFKMTFNKGSRSDSTEMTVIVKAGDPPRVTIRPQTNSKENPSEVVKIKALVSSTLPSTNVTWESVEEDGFAYLDLSTAGTILTPLQFTFEKASGRAKATRGCALVIAKDKLSGGVQYKFRLTAKHRDSDAYGDAVIRTNAAPSQGTLTVSPSNGTSMETVFTVTAGEGWSDDADDLPLNYQFGYIDPRTNKEELQGMFGGSNQREIKFPPGDENNARSLTVFVNVKDQLGAVTRQTATITVMPVAVTTAILDNAKDDILKSFESADWNSALGNMGALLSAVPCGPVNDPVQAAAITSMKESFAGSTMNILESGGVTDDPAAKRTMYCSMGSITNCGKSMSSKVKLRAFRLIKGIECCSSGSRRKRRATGGSGSGETYTEQEAEQALSILSNLIDASSYDSASMTLKNDFRPVVDSSGVKVCRGVAVGMPAVMVNDQLVVLRVEKNSLANVDTQFTDIACNDCPDYLSNSAKVLLGASIKSAYASWDCNSGGDTCTGVCLDTSQFVYDILSTSVDNTSLTNVVDVKLFNPETYATVSVSSLATPMTYRLPLKTNVTVDTNSTYLACKRWSSGSWVTTGCVTTQTLVSDNGTDYVECNCTETGYIMAFTANEAPIVTTLAPSTTPPTTTTTTAPVATTIRRVRFALVGDYDTLVTPATENELKANISKALASTMGLPVSRIVNMTLSKGSIVVNFALVAPANETSTDLKTYADKLNTAITSSTFTVETSSGTLKADPASFSTTEGNEQPTAPAPPISPTESGLTETEKIIIGCVVGGVLLIVLIVVVVVCTKKKQSNRRSMKVSPESSRAQLREGENMEMDGRNNKVDGNYNEGVDA